MVTSVQAHYHQHLAATTPAGDPQEDLDVLKNLEEQLAQLLAQLKQDGPSPELLKEIGIMKDAVRAQLDEFEADAKAAHGGKLPSNLEGEIRNVNEDLDSVTIDLNNLAQDPKSQQFLENLEDDLNTTDLDIENMKYQ